MRQEWIDREIKTAVDGVLYAFGKRGLNGDEPVSPITLSGAGLDDEAETLPPAPVVGPRKATRQQRKRGKRK